ncbi:protein of unknown function [Ruminococcaceae bacterium BL-6]|nr:protein of unknown function [Ruminococcaceae bacterium BL-6]
MFFHAKKFAAANPKKRAAFPGRCAANRGPRINSFHLSKITLTEKTLKGRISMDIIAMILLIIGGINWGSIGIFQFDIIAWAFGSQAEIISRIIYTLVGLSAIWCISLLFRDNDIVERHSTAESPHH